MNTICPEFEGGTLLYHCDTCEMTYTPEELDAFVIG